jgi:dipeptidyl aminopeptidase/acylaminoacyl peptidase
MRTRVLLPLLPRLVALLCLVAASAHAQTPRAMTLLDFLNVPRLTDPQLSPDGKQILFVRSDPDWKANKRITHVWRVNADGSGLVQMTSGADGENTPRWSPDGRTIAFVAKRAGAEAAQIQLISNAGGEAVTLTSHESAVDGASTTSGITWSPDGRAIYFLSSEPKTAEEKAREKAKDDVKTYDEDFKQRHLWKVTIATKTEQRLTGGAYSVLGYGLSPDGSRLVIERAPTPLYADAEQSEVWTLNAADGRDALQLTKNGVGETAAALSPDNSQVLFLSQANAQFETYYNRKLFVMPTKGGAARVVAANVPYEIDRAAWSKDGKAIYFLANLGVHSELFRVDAAGGAPKQLTEGQHAIQDWDFVAATGRHALLIDEAGVPAEVWTLADDGAASGKANTNANANTNAKANGDAAANASAKPVQVTHVFADLPRTFKLPKQERIEWKGADGVTVEGLLHYPVDYTPGTKYPLIVQTHGGPMASDKFGFSSWGNYVPVLAGKGYAVLQPNYRGSTGYGDAFLRDMVNHYFQNAHLDVMAGVDQVIKLGVADPDRLAAMGWSAGGHMTNKLITFTDRFKAASSGAGAANWVSMYAQSDVRSYRTPWFGGTPWQKNAPIDAYWNNSPLKDIANVKTPTIFLVGENDPRVPLPQSVEMHRGLKSNGIPTHLYTAPREPHGWQELRHQLFKQNVELEWFEKYVTKRPYTWEKAPGDPKPEPKPTETATAQR